MHIIPVIDLLGGCAVHARRGQRAHYQPVASRLCDGSAPADVASAMLAYCAADTLYVADLDAIGGGPVQAAVLRTLLGTLPGITCWLDAGFASAAAAEATLAALGAHAPRVVPVFGSESLGHASPFARYPHAALSLDQRGGVPLGDAYWWQQASGWPRDIIAMTLDQVGAFNGPDLGMIARLRTHAGADRRIIGAGGIRDASDLQAAAAAGAHAWLVASALHELRIPPRTQPHLPPHAPA
ncbi:nickel transporter [Imbroritus primus]|uniref:Nickel transporter n=1 Tax=Imbroritus primus TaxID=3058603 RepID=A0ACD3SN81_9BURK|nr:nickel transporter [Burkholderiaceae bacterium PBA]